jgi:glycosyltransferase involved in cell wall biosynthesis
MKNKKTVLMLPSWYPTKQNPWNGSFFKEQALALDNYYDFNVLLYKEKRTFLLIAIIKNIFFSKIIEINKVNNITEFTCTVYIPLINIIGDIIYDFWTKNVQKNTQPGVGKYKHSRSLKYRKYFLRKLINKTRLLFDYVYGVTAQDMAVPSYLLSQISNKPLVLAEHAPFPWPGDTISNLVKDAIEQSDLFLAISKDKIRQVLLQNIQLRHIEYIGNLIDETIFKYEPIKHNVTTFVIVAAYSFYKQYNLFIKIFNELVSLTNLEFKIIVAGYGANKGYSNNSEVLEEKLKNTDFFDKIELVPYISRSDIHSLYNRSDAFIITSIQEGQPVSALEAGCCGLPIFSTRCGGVEDYVTDEIGRLFDITDYSNFAISLKDFLEKKIFFDNITIRNRIVSKFGKISFTNNFHNYLSSLDSKCLQ